MSQIIQPRTPSGVMELLPRDQIAFQRILDIIRLNYERYGFLPIETPVFEVADVLLTKSGGETEKQVYFVQKTGSLEQGRKPELALRFDLTVPLARYVAEHEHELAFPFRRYQIQRVYRGERTQRGRANEFYQCDIDIIGKDSLSPAYDAELPAIINDVFTQLAFGPFTIWFSNRKVMLGFLQANGIPVEAQTLALRELDKLDKSTPEKVAAALVAAGLTSALATQLMELVQPASSNDEVLNRIARLPQSGTLAEGYEELQIMCDALAAQGVPPKNARLNLGIIRGLDYYTGTVYETKMDDHPEFGSVCGGGRYDNLAGYYTKSKLPGVGLSIGATRLFEHYHAAGFFADTRSTIQVLVTVMDETLLPDYLKIAHTLRQGGLATEVFLDGGKMAKQMKYADRAAIPVAVVMGGDEKSKGAVTVKNMKTGSQIECKAGDILATVTAELKK
ncbi:MAG: histidine--tRNA ligase [Bdellovibrionales bacterium]